MHPKKILFISYDNKNLFIKYLINSLKENYTVDLYNTKKYKQFNFTRLSNLFFNKIIDLFSSYKNSEKEKFYVNYQIIETNNIAKRIFYYLKKLLNHFDLTKDKSSIYNKIYKDSYKFKFLIKKYDFIICDFRLNELYNQNHRLIYEAANLKETKLIAWVYSWDNIFHSSVMKHADYVFIWNKFFENILIKKHNYRPDQIKVTGNIQFDYLKKIKIKKKNKNKQILFACSYGTDQNNTGDNFILDEKKILEIISNNLKNIDKKFKVVVRPYPSAIKSEYESLKNLGNVQIEEYGKLQKRRKNYNEMIRFDKNFRSKLNQIVNSDIIISFGSTFNIEAAIMNKIVLHIDFSVLKSQKNKSYNFFKNRMEYLKILKSKKFPNIIKNKQQLDLVLREILLKKKSEKYLKYSLYLKKIFYNRSLSIDLFKNNLNKL